MGDVIEIDGAVMEGGGQILRMSMAFSALLKKPIRVINIRAGRSTPGLRPQHLAGLELIRDISNGKLLGAEIGSTEISYWPGDIKAGKYYADPGTAGSVVLLFQVSFPCLLFADGPVELHLKGGTNADMAPQIDDMLMVFKPIIARMGAYFDCQILKRGYYPKGGGEVVIKVNPVENNLKPIELTESSDIVSITGKSYVAGTLPIKLAHIMRDAACLALKKKFHHSPKIDVIKEPPHLAVGNGSGIIIVAKTSNDCYFGGSGLGKRGIDPAQVGQESAQQIIEDIENGACVDKHIQDQLIIFMALAKGTSRIRCGEITLHTKTAIYIAEKMSKAKLQIVKEEQPENNIIVCEGISLTR